MHRCQLFSHNQGIHLNKYMQVVKDELGGSCRIETSRLICSVNQRSDLSTIGTSVMKTSRRSSSTYTESLFLHVVNHNLPYLFSCFFFYLVFLSRIFTIHRTAGEGGGYLLISFLPVLPASQKLGYQLGYCCRELTSAHSWQLESNMESLLHTIQNSLFLHLHWQMLLFEKCLKIR